MSSNDLQSTDSAFKGIGYGDQPPPLPIFSKVKNRRKTENKGKGV